MIESPIEVDRNIWRTLPIIRKSISSIDTANDASKSSIIF